MKASLPANEEDRLRALSGYELLDCLPDEVLDEITHLAAYICECPIASVSVIDGERQWYKSKVGMAASQTPRDLAFCAHTILQHDLLLVSDATKDPRFADNPFVVGDPKVRFYAGVPLINPEGYALGTLCVVDTQPRQLTENQNRALESLRRQVVTHLELRRALLERRWAEAEVHRLNDELEARVEERTAQLATANESLQKEMSEREKLQRQVVQIQKMEAVGRLAGGIAHDFNNILLVISGYCDLMLAQCKADHPLFHFVKEVEKAGGRGTALTRQLLAFSRQQIIEPKVLDLNEAVDNMLGMLHRLIGEDIDFVVKKGEDLGPVRVDPGQMEQVIMNLVINACDAMPQGGHLLLETSSCPLEKSRETCGCELEPHTYSVLTVRDSGSGIPDDVKARLFEPFFTTKAEGEGTGLGLATCYGIAKQNSGTITCDSQPGQGTAFHVYLPSVTEEKTRFKTGHLPPPPRGNETLLLVEDDPAVRELTGLMLRELGYTVHETADGIDALAFAKSRPEVAIDLLITDVVMPHMNGRELVEQLARLRPEVKSLLVSGHTDDALVHHGVLNSQTNFLQKPYRPYLLAQRVRDALASTTATEFLANTDA